MLTNRRANVIGIGMIGGSVAVALRKQQWHVSGVDIDAARLDAASQRQVIDARGIDADASITFVATPVSSVVDQALAVIGNGGIVTDVASVKEPIVRGVKAPNFVGGHPMAGSEKSGLDGVDADLFEGATWVLTPDDSTSPDAYLETHNVVTSLGASVVTLAPVEHDAIVATISHVPHLAATALMTGALTSDQSHDTVLRLAAGGFRDMTRIAAGSPDLWVDIVNENRQAIGAELLRLRDHIEELHYLVSGGRLEELHRFLDRAAIARQNLPRRSGRPQDLALVRIPIPDRAGAMGYVLSVFGDIKVNVEDIDIAHDLKGDRGVLQVTIAADAVDTTRDAFHERGLRVATERL